MRPTLSRLYLSPHFDDVVLSCGGSIAAAVDRGESCRVVTVFAGEPRLEQVSGVAVRLQREWGMAGDGVGALEAVRSRRLEDEEGLRRLGVPGVYFDELDCIYRRREAGGWRIGEAADIFGGYAREDARLLSRLAERFSQLDGVDASTTIYVPLAVGRHCDHELVRAAAEAWRPEQLCYYEDFPYVVHPGQLAATLGELDAWEAELEFLSTDQLARRLRAALAYRSQVPFLFGDEAGLEAAMRAYAMECGHVEQGLAERRWRAVEPGQGPRILDRDPSGQGVSGHGLGGA